MHNEKVDNNVLRSENDRIRRENIAMQELLKKRICPSCGCPPLAKKEKKKDLKKLQRENLELRRQFERTSNILANYMGRPPQGGASDKLDASLARKESGNPTFEVDCLSSNTNGNKSGLAYQMKANPEMTGIATSCMHELIKLLRIDQPLWIKSPIDDLYVLDRDKYEQIFPQPSGLRFLKSRKESSKDTGVVNMDARLLVDLYLDANGWVHHLPTAVSRARVIHVLEAGFLGTRSGSLQLIHEQMNILSPLIQPQEFYILRVCQQIETGIWVIADVSCDLSDNCRIPLTSCWKHPSGCMIQDMSNGMSKVTCVEHVEIGDNFLFHPAHEDLVKTAFRFGAKRWIMTLQRICHRYFYLSEGDKPGHELGGRRSMMMLAFRMVRSYCSIFGFLGTANLHQSSEVTKNGVQISLRKSSGPGQPIGIVILAASSFWVPASPQGVTKYLTDHKMRSQWDVLCYGNHVCEITRIPTGRHSANHITVLQALNPSENMIFQETMIEQSGSIIVYAPIHASIVSQLAMGIDSTTIPILSSGFAINKDGPGQRVALSTSAGIPWSGGSFLTVGFQLLACSSLSTKDLSADAIPSVHAFVNRTVRSIRAAFGC